MSQSQVSVVINPYPAGSEIGQKLQMITGHFYINAGSYPANGLPVSWALEPIKAVGPNPPGWQASWTPPLGQKIVVAATPGYTWTATTVTGPTSSSLPSFTTTGGPVTDNDVTWTMTSGGPQPIFAPIIYEDSPGANSGGGIAVAVLHSGAGGSGYNVGDTGIISGAGGANATYVITTVSAGAVTAFSIVNPGSSYSASTSDVTTKATSGGGTGFAIDITYVYEVSGYVYTYGLDGNLHILVSNSTAGDPNVEVTTTTPTPCTYASIAFVAWFSKG